MIFFTSSGSVIFILSSPLSVILSVILSNTFTSAVQTPQKFRFYSIYLSVNNRLANCEKQDHKNTKYDTIPSKNFKVMFSYIIHQKLDHQDRYDK